MYFAVAVKVLLFANLYMVALASGLMEAKNCQAVGSTSGNVVVTKNGVQVGSVQRDPCTGDKNFAIASDFTIAIYDPTETTQ